MTLISYLTTDWCDTYLEDTSETETERGDIQIPQLSPLLPIQPPIPTPVYYTTAAVTAAVTAVVVAVTAAAIIKVTHFIRII